MVLAQEAELLLLDEPTAALDADGEARLIAAIVAHREAGGRVVLATHQPVAIGTAATLALDDFAPVADALVALEF
jgi:heme exporter protein A